MKMTLEDLKKDGTYRFIELLCQIMDDAGLKNEPMEIPLEAVLQADCPPYLPYAAAVKTKILFVLAIYSSAGRFGSLLDGLQGVTNMIGIVTKDWEKKK
jgi:hypothetical protein